MDNSYFEYIQHTIAGLQHEGYPRAMAAPPPVSPSTLHQPDSSSNGYLVDFSSGGLSASSDTYPNALDHSWRTTRASGHPLPVNRPHSALHPSQPSESSAQNAHSYARPQRTSGRTTAITPDIWMRYKSVIHKLWIEDDKPLPEIMATMSEKHHFYAS